MTVLPMHPTKLWPNMLLRTHARDEAVANYAAESEARQSAESLAEERKKAMGTEERLRLDTAETLFTERQQQLHAEAGTRTALAALAAEEGRRWADVARVARLSEELDRLSLITGGLIEERNQLVSVIFDDFRGQILAQQEG